MTAMDLTSDIAPFDNPELSPSIPGSNFFGGEVPNEILLFEDIPIRTKGAVGQTDHMPDGRSHGDHEDSSKGPHNDTYRVEPCTWEEGLQAIEDFDWSDTNDVVQHDHVCGDGPQDGERRETTGSFELTPLQTLVEVWPATRTQTTNIRHSSPPRDAEPNENSRCVNSPGLSPITKRKPVEALFAALPSPPNIFSSTRENAMECHISPYSGQTQSDLSNSKANDSSSDEPGCVKVETVPAEGFGPCHASAIHGSTTEISEGQSIHTEGLVAQKDMGEGSGEISNSKGAKQGQQVVDAPLIDSLSNHATLTEVGRMPSEAFPALDKLQHMRPKEDSKFCPTPVVLPGNETPAAMPCVLPEQRVAIIAAQNVCKPLENEAMSIPNTDTDFAMSLPTLTMMPMDSSPTKPVPMRAEPTGDVLNENRKETLQETITDTSLGESSDDPLSDCNELNCAESDVSFTPAAREFLEQEQPVHRSTSEEEQPSIKGTLRNENFLFETMTPNSGSDHKTEGKAEPGTPAEAVQTDQEYRDMPTQSVQASLADRAKAMSETDMYSPESVLEAVPPKPLSNSIDIIIDPGQSVSLSTATFEIKPAISLKRTRSTQNSQNAIEIEEEARAKKKQKIAILSAPLAAMGIKAISTEIQDLEVNVPATNMEYDSTNSVIEKPVSDSPEVDDSMHQMQVEESSKPSYVSSSQVFRQTEEPVSPITQCCAEGAIVDVKMQIHEHQNGNDGGIKMEGHYSGAEAPALPPALAPVAVSKPRKARIRNLVSKQELRNLYDNAPRDQSTSKRKAEEDVSVIPDLNSGLHLNGNEASPPEESLAASMKVLGAQNPLGLVDRHTSDGVNGTDTLAEMEAVSKKADNIRETQGSREAEHPMTMTHLIVPPEIKTPPAKAANEAQPSMERKHPLDLGYGKRHTRGDTLHDGLSTQKHSAALETDQARKDTEEGTGLLQRPENEKGGDWSNADVAKVKAAKDDTLPLPLQTESVPLPIPEMPIPPSTSTTLPPKDNKFGFTRGKGAAPPRKAAANATPTPKKKKNTVVSSQSGKPETEAPTPSTAGVPDNSPAASRDPGAHQKRRASTLHDMRKTRRTSALEEEIRRREEREGNVKLRLRGRDADEAR